MCPTWAFLFTYSVKERIKSREDQLWSGKTPDAYLEIDFNVDGQIKLLQEFESYYADFPFEVEKKEGLRFQLNNAAYSYSDAYILYSLIRKYEPKKIIEIGSGFSSALMLDMKDIYANDLELSFVEPFPIQLNKLISDTDKSNAKIIQKKVQDVDLSVFKALQKNDILFIDSSHVSKTGSDVNYEFFDIIPNLNSGAIIHVHDIFYPFEYSKHWV